MMQWFVCAQMRALIKIYIFVKNTAKDVCSRYIINLILTWNNEPHYVQFLICKSDNKNKIEE